jgi:hypothetical protein
VLISRRRKVRPARQAAMVKVKVVTTVVMEASLRNGNMVIMVQLIPSPLALPRTVFNATARCPKQPFKSDIRIVRIVSARSLLRVSQVEITMIGSINPLILNSFCFTCRFSLTQLLECLELLNFSIFNSE